MAEVQQLLNGFFPAAGIEPGDKLNNVPSLTGCKVFPFTPVGRYVKTVLPFYLHPAVAAFEVKTAVLHVVYNINCIYIVYLIIGESLFHYSTP